MTLEDVVHGAHGCLRVELALPGGEALPYICLVALMTPAEAQGIGDLSGLVRAQRRVERGAAGGEAGGPVCPAAGLHAADRDGHRRVRPHEDGSVQDAVLLGADQLLAVEQ